MDEPLCINHGRTCSFAHGKDVGDDILCGFCFAGTTLSRYNAALRLVRRHHMFVRCLRHSVHVRDV